jgi:hypothetical protein
MVVFPVFTAVMGLICLAGAVPAISVVEISEKMSAGTKGAQTITSAPKELGSK